MTTERNLDRGMVGRAVAADIFVSKFNSSLESLEFSTYLGGSGHDVVPQIALDDSGTIHVAGTTVGFATGVRSSRTRTGPIRATIHKATGVTDDFPTLHADQAAVRRRLSQCGNVLRRLERTCSVTTGLARPTSIDLPVDGFVLAIDQPGSAERRLSRI